MFFRHLKKNQEVHLEYIQTLTSHLKDTTQKQLVHNTLSASIEAITSNQKGFFFCRLMCAVFITAAIIINALPIQNGWIQFATVVLCTLAILLMVADGIFRYQDTWSQKKALASALEEECLIYLNNTSVYQSLGDPAQAEEKEKLFVERIMSILHQEKAPALAVSPVKGPTSVFFPAEEFVQEPVKEPAAPILEKKEEPEIIQEEQDQTFSQ